MHFLAGHQILGLHGDAGFKRCVEHAIHGGAQRDQIPDVARVMKHQAVHGGGDGGAPRVAHGGQGPGQVHQVHHLPAQHVAQPVGVGRQRQLGVFGDGFAHRLAFDGHAAAAFLQR